MNLNKYTKAELISKFNKLDSKTKDSQNSIFNQIKSYLVQNLKLMLTFKDILIKITLISFFIQIFKKYKLFRRIWMVLNSIIVAIFGISLIDNLGFEFINHFFIEVRLISWNIVDYLSNTHFYQFLKNLFVNKEEIPSNQETNKNGSISEFKKESSNNEPKIRASEGNSKISEWLKPEKPEIIEESSNENNYKKYLLLTSLLIGSCLLWVYFDEVKETSVSLWEWLSSFRPGTRDNSDGDNSSDRTITTASNREMIPINSEASSPIIEMADIQKRVMRSPSLEQLNSKVSESWSEEINSSGPSSPASTSSVETIKPSSSTSNSAVESIRESSELTYDNLTEIEVLVLDMVNKEWRERLPLLTRERISFIESNSDNIHNLYLKKEMVNFLSEIEIFQWNLIKSTNNLVGRVPEIEITHLKLIQIKLNDWITKYSEILFK